MNILDENWEEMEERVRENLDLYQVPPQVGGYFEKEMNTSPALTALVFQEYKRFMLIYFLAKENEVVIPSHWVKIAWEDHIVQTAVYRDFCYKVFGKFLHS